MYYKATIQYNSTELKFVSGFHLRSLNLIKYLNCMLLLLYSLTSVNKNFRHTEKCCSFAQNET